MGNSSLNAGLHLQLERLDYYSGEYINGMIYIQINEMLTPCSLWFYFKGRETSQWTTGSGKHRRHHRGRSILANYSQQLFVWDRGLLQGSLQLPFSFCIPSGLPGSFLFQAVAKGSIEYICEVKLITQEKKVAKGIAQIFLKQAFDPSEFRLNVINESTANVKNCCVSKGRCLIKTTVPQNSYTPVDTINVRVELDNSESQLDIQWTVCTLLRCVRMFSNSGRQYFGKFPICLVRGEEMRAGNSLVSMDLPLNLAALPNGFVQSYSTTGKLVQCFYTIEVKAVLRGTCTCCGPTPKVETLVMLYAPYMEPPPLPPPPENWRPESLPQVDMQYNAVYDDKASSPPDDDFFKES